MGPTCITTDLSIEYLWELFGMAARIEGNVACCEIAAAFHIKNLRYDSILSKQPGFFEGIPSRYLAVLLTGNFQWEHYYVIEQASRPQGFKAVAIQFAKMKGGTLVR